MPHMPEFSAAVEPEFASVLEELRPREPLFHTAAFGLAHEARERSTASAYWEVGASGRRYSRAFILRYLHENPPVDAAQSGWRCSEFGLRPVSQDTWLLTYLLNQNGRLSRRMSLWQKTHAGWQVLYHQGTLAAGGEDDTPPRPEETPPLPPSG